MIERFFTAAAITALLYAVPYLISLGWKHGQGTKRTENNINLSENFIEYIESLRGK